MLNFDKEIMIKDRVDREKGLPKIVRNVLSKFERRRGSGDKWPDSRKRNSQRDNIEIAQKENGQPGDLFFSEY